MMKITAALNGVDAYEDLVRAGADELFAGYVPFEWLEKYSNITPLNRREVLLHDLQIDTIGEMRLLADKAAKHGVPVALTFNSICYAPAQYSMITDMLGELYELGFGDWIIADPALLLHLKRQNVPGRIHLSGEAGCFNPDAMALFAPLGVSRFIFPRKISPAEMAECIRSLPGLEYEAFALNEKCHFSGAFCSSLHCDELDHLCHVPYLPSGPDFGAEQPEREYDGFGASGCALCALQDLEKAGVTHLKLVGRGADPRCLVRDVSLMRRALEMRGASPEELRRQILGGSCGGNCYYPPA